MGRILIQACNNVGCLEADLQHLAFGERMERAWRNYGRYSRTDDRNNRGSAVGDQTSRCRNNN